MTNIDLSSVVVAKMTSKYPRQVYLEMDMLALQFADETFDAIIDKASIDTLQTEVKDPWNVDM